MMLEIIRCFERDLKKCFYMSYRMILNVISMLLGNWRSLKVGMFHSFKGGTGKTTLALNVAKYLADEGNHVLLLETDLEMPCFLSLLPPPRWATVPQYFWNDVMDPSSGIGLRKAIIKANEHLSIVYANSPIDQKGAFTYPIFADQSFYRQSLLKLQRELVQLDTQDEYDYLIFDASPGISYGTVNLLILASTVFLVLRPVYHDVRGAFNLFKSMYKLYFDEKEVILVWNQVARSKKIRNEYISQWNEQFARLYEESNLIEDEKRDITSLIFPYSERIAELHAEGEIFFPEDSDLYDLARELTKFL